MMAAPLCLSPGVVTINAPARCQKCLVTYLLVLSMCLLLGDCWNIKLLLLPRVGYPLCYQALFSNSPQDNLIYQSRIHSADLILAFLAMHRMVLQQRQALHT